MKIKIFILLIIIYCAGNVLGSEDYASTHLTEAPESISVPDSMSLGVILIQFSDWATNDTARGGVGYDQEGDPIYGYYEYQDYYNMLFSEGTYLGYNIHPGTNHKVFGSMRDYYLEVSHARPGGQFYLSGSILNDVDANDVPIWYTASHVKAYYGDTLSHNDTTFAHEAITLANNNGYNTNNYDKLCILYAGSIDNSDNCLHAHANEVNGGWYITAEKLYNVFSHIGVHCHEFAHLLGLSDHYHGDEYNVPSYGRWGLMGTGYKNGPNYGSCPAHLTGRSKVELGFVPIEDIGNNTINYAQTILPTSNNTSDILFRRAAIYPAYHHGVWHEETEDILIENRQQITGTFDKYLPGEGLLVYVENVLLEADGSVHLDTSNISNSGDPFPGSSSNTKLTDFTTPNSIIRDGTVLSHFAVLDISVNGDSVIADFIPNYWQGTISSDTTWYSSKSPYYIGGDIVVSSGVTLTIEANTEVIFAANTDNQSSGLDNSLSELIIEGKIEADSVTFTSTSSSANSWYGIILDGVPYTSYIKNSTIEWAKRGIIVDDCSPSIEGNDLDNNQYGIWVHGSSSYPVVEENDINNGSLPLVVSSDAEPYIYDNKSRGLNNCLYIASGGYPEVRNNTLYGYPYGSYQIYITGSNSGINTASSSGDGNYFTDDVTNDIVLIDGGCDFVFEYDVFENISSASYDYIDNNDATQCEAENCYWDNGGVPSSSYFDGNVDYTPVLASEPGAGVTWKLLASSPSPFENGFQAYKSKNYEYAASELKTVFENNYDHEDARRALFYISRSAMRISEKVPYLTFFEEIIKSQYDEELKQIARSALMKQYARTGNLSKSESYAMEAPRGTLYDRELLLDMVYYYSLYEDEIGEARVISVLTEVYGDDKSIEVAIENVKLLVVDERKLMKMSQADENLPGSDVENTSNENLLSAFPNPFNPSTTIRYTLKEPGNMTLKIYNIN